MDDRLKHIPSVDKVMRSRQVREVWQDLPDAYVADAARAELARIRKDVREGGDVPDLAAIATAVVARARFAAMARPRRVLNLAGVPIHTNLGRVPLGPRAVRAIVQAAEGYSDLEFDLSTGERGSRLSHVQDLLAALTGAPAAAVVNNNAAAVLLSVSAMAAPGEVVIARGQLVEIGGAFRIPDVMAQSGATLVEVGATNKVRLADYERAIGERTSALMWVHPSNFRMIGFTEDVPLPDLARLAHAHQLPLIADLGSGVLVDLQLFGLAHEPTVREVVQSGADIVSFSGDKLLGAPQAGIVVGTTEAVQRLRRHPLYRAVRSDKLTLAGLSATLQAYYEGTAESEVPVLQMLGASPAAIASRAQQIVRRLRRRGIAAQTCAGESVAGGGALPGQPIATTLVLLPDLGSAQDLLTRLRATQPPVIGRIVRERVALDPRCLLEGEMRLLMQALEQVLLG